MRTIFGIFALLALAGCSTTAQVPENSDLSPADVNALTAGYQLIHFDLLECNEVQTLSDDKTVLAVAAKLCAEANGYAPGLENLASAHDVTLPNSLPEAYLERYLSLHYMGSSADIQYLKDQIHSHKKALAEFQEEVSKGQNNELIGDSRAVIPVVQDNLALLRQTLKSME